MTYSHLFGPVSSRRLGRSLGIDLVPFKTCTYNCVYCECGATTDLTTERNVFFPVEEIKSELVDFLAGSPPLDFLTLSGSGEPTLSLSIGEVIRFLKKHYPAYQVAVLTNGSLLSDPAVRRDLQPVDVVLPTLTSISEPTFRKIHRPAPEISLEKVLWGLVQFRKEYSGEIWLEVFIIPGVNTSDEELLGIRHLLREITPDQVQLNTLDRPGTEDWVIPANKEELGRVLDILDYPSVESIPLPQYPTLGSPNTDDSMELVSSMIRRRPCTIDNIVAATGLHQGEINKILRVLAETHDLHTKREDRGIFYYLRN